MSLLPSCPRCGGDLRAPGFWSSAWQCDRHGEVHPFHLAPTPTLPALDKLVADARVPVWVPHPLPVDWTVTGLGGAGDDRTGVRASLVALSGPGPNGGPADVVLVAEEPGIGLGARFAGLAGTDPGAEPDGAPDAKVEAAGHPTALWRTATGDDVCAAFAGEAKGLWLWLVAWPPESISAVNGVALHDMRDGPLPELELVFGAAMPRLAPSR
ncbi:MAG TPA: DUF6758 family protein [Mycobacteriales bacterium]|nr:DUF6758 family protein [Mycobacteriales bacterium]